LKLGLELAKARTMIKLDEPGYGSVGNPSSLGTFMSDASGPVRLGSAFQRYGTCRDHHRIGSRNWFANSNAQSIDGRCMACVRIRLSLDLPVHDFNYGTIETLTAVPPKQGQPARTDRSCGIAESGIAKS
jgi:hypothetical protein